MKDVKIFNESSAITMYYGYTKYKDIFLNKDNKIDKNIEKNILFIDIGLLKLLLFYLILNIMNLK